MGLSKTEINLRRLLAAAPQQHNQAKLVHYVATLREQLEQLAEERTPDGVPRLQTICQRKRFISVVLSGGSLIDTMRKLIEQPYKESINGSKWLIFWLDERVVPVTDPRSNYKLAYDGFLSKVGIPHENIYAINDKLSPKGAADDYEAHLKDLATNTTIELSKASGFPKFDLMLLGMGPDGHVASMFPGHPQRFEKKRWVTFIKDSPKPPPERITLTFPMINSASDIALVVTGAQLANATCIALGKCSNCPHKDLLPVQMVSPEGEKNALPYYTTILRN